MSNGAPTDPKKEGLQSASDWLKLTLTLSTGALVFGTGLVKEHLDFADWLRVILVAAWLLLAVAASAGIVALSAIPMMLAKSDYNLENPILTWPARIHQIAFMIGTLCLGTALAVGFLQSPPAKQVPSTLTAAPAVAPSSLEIKFVRDSEEYWALTRQIYQLAGDAVEKAPKPMPPMGWAVVLDVDETALDNSSYQLERVAYGIGFSQASWRAWVQRGEAPAVPGVKMFIDKVRRIEGSRVAWITDRESSADSGLDQTAATRDNLRKVGLWEDSDLLCMKASNKKKDRRQELATGRGACSWPGTQIQVLVFVGDQMGDFPGQAEDSATGERTFGYRFFLLPNPMYGEWVSSTSRPISH